MSLRISKLEEQKEMDETKRKETAFYNARMGESLWAWDAKKLHELFNDHSKAALQTILGDWNDPAAIGRQLKILVDDLWADIDA